mgnify:CR=1 FL=1
MLDKVKELIEEVHLFNATSKTDIEAFRIKYLGSKGLLKGLFSEFKNVDVELRKENDKALKRKVKRLKTSMQTLAVSHENASTYPGKELKSSNKNRLQIRCIEL